jgi:hypothetical protein
VADSGSTESKPTKRAAAAGAETQKQGGTGGGTDPVMIPVGQLASDGADLLGYESHVVAGALSGHDPDEEMSIDNATQAVKLWLAQPVQVDPATVGEEG